MNKKINKAIFPVAGLGSRFLPVTKAQPKEMLPIINKPLIQYVVEEAVMAGITEMIFITGRNKQIIKNYFDKAYELENKLEVAGKIELLKTIQNIIPKNITCTFIHQLAPLGLGHAILCARSVIGENPFAVLLADDFIEVNSSKKSLIEIMIKIYEREDKSILAVQDVALNEVQNYGNIITTSYQWHYLEKVKSIVEKPKVENTSSTLAIIGRYILNNSIFDCLEMLKNGINGEIQLTDGIAALMKTESVLAYRYTGKRYDCGSALGYLKANVAVGSKHPDIGLEFSEYLKNFNVL